MSSTLSAFHWKGQPSETGAALGRTQRAPKNPAPSLIFTKKQLRKAEASKVGSTSRAPTANISGKGSR